MITLLSLRLAGLLRSLHRGVDLAALQRLELSVRIRVEPEVTSSIAGWPEPVWVSHEPVKSFGPRPERTTTYLVFCGVIGQIVGRLSRRCASGGCTARFGKQIGHRGSDLEGRRIDDLGRQVGGDGDMAVPLLFVGSVDRVLHRQPSSARRRSTSCRCASCMSRQFVGAARPALGHAGLRRESQQPCRSGMARSGSDLVVDDESADRH